ncbi:MAG: amino acid adenylation domain-containing protein [Anaerolineales bacterium]|nr:amino acid adenylation domain-containing protein [Anaerolineales bacterium]
MKQTSRLASSQFSPPLNSLVKILLTRAQEQPDELVYRFIQDDQSEVISITYGELDRRARAIGAWLESFGARGERALLLYPAGMDFVASFMGCLYAGVTAVPAYPPRLNRPVPRIQSIVDDSRASFALTTSTILLNIEQRFEHAPDLQALHWLNTDQVPAGLEADWRDPQITSDTLAFLQYTSGSTSQPKGVMVSHGNLMHNLKAISHGFHIDSSVVGVFWLPSYHDMGLIGGMLEPMYLGGSATWMSPVSFLQRPVRWLEAISRYRGNSCGAPNFAYDLCVDKVTPEQMETLDLSSWTLAFCGAEPIRPETLERFARTFAGCGFQKSSFYPCFGMAESTLIVSGGDGPSEPRTFTVDRKSLEHDLVVPASPDDDGSWTMVNCGKPIIDQKIVIANPTTLEQSTSDQVGEIWVSGPSVAQGYWRLEDETRNTFRAYLSDTGDGPFLRTGDLGFLKDGELFVTGRLKDLIIIHGSNHYPQDIELSVESSHIALQPAGGAAFSVTDGGKERLVIVQEVTRQNRKPDINEVASAIRQAVAEKHDLQVFAIVLVKPMSIPKTSSGKIQRRACKKAFLENTLEVVGQWNVRSSSLNQVTVQKAEKTEPIAQKSIPDIKQNKSAVAIQSWLMTHIASMLEIESTSIDPRQPFTYYGLGSIQAVSLTGDLEVYLSRTLAPTLAWDYPTIELLANYLANDSQQVKHVSPSPTPIQLSLKNTNEPIAIIGLSCRFPKASNPQAFWELLRNGVDAITEVPPDRWNVDDFYSSDPATPGKVTSRWGGFLDGIDLFDPHFFGISPREATRMDPQQRLLLEVSWEALENAFIPPQSLAGSRTGVFIGISSSDYSRLQFDDPEKIDAYAGTGNAHSIAANRLSYLFDLRGPSMAVDTACSSSLVAVHLACQSLRSGESDLGLVGGVNLILTPELTITFSQARMLSPDGRCKTFDASADGYVRGEGCGVVILKRLSDAVRDGDNILALINGSAVNQDGRSNGLTAPNGLAQQDVIRQALANANVAPHQISYVEAHGTGTPLGDPIEIASLRAVLDDGQSKGRVLVGSAKTNIGHLESAAGIAGLIKAVLALQNEAIPPHLHLKEVNPYLLLEDSRLEIGTYLRPWKRRDQPRFAGVSSFGFGGTNAHIILSEAPLVVSETLTDEPKRPRHILALSAKTETALEELAYQTSYQLKNSNHSPSDISFTANTSRSHFDHRLAIQAGSSEELKKELVAFVSNTTSASIGHVKPGAQPKIAFLFTGQGSQYPGMGRQLYETQPVFRAALDQCAQILESILDRPLLEILFPTNKDDFIHQTTYTQPALFAFEYALAQMWQSWGIAPHAVLGHSVGEYVAACVAGVFSLEDGLRLITDRARLMGALPQNGTMAAVFADTARIAEILKPYQDQVSIAAVNGSENTVISGESSAVQLVLDELTKLGISSKPLNVSHAFHSPLMDPILDDFESAARRIHFNAPRLSLISNLNGGILEPDQTPDANYWRQHLRAEVKFSAGMQSLANLGIDAFIEIGPSPVLLGMGRQCLPESKSSWLPSLRQGQDDWQTMLDSLGKLYVQGAEIDWAGFDQGYTRHKVSLPNYPFERQRYWLEPSTRKSSIIKMDVPAPSLTPRSNGKSQPHHEETIDRGNHKEPKPQSLPVNDLNHASLLATEIDKRQRVLEDFLQRQAARILGMDVNRLGLNQPLDTVGLDSLMAIEFKNTVESKLGITLSIASLLQGPTISSLATEALGNLDSPEASNDTPLIVAQESSDESPLSYGQQALWFLHQLLPEEISFNVTGAVRVISELDVPALERAFQQLVARYETLRSTFHVVAGEPIQRVHSSTDIHLHVEDASAWSDAQLHTRLSAEAHRSFDLENGPILRVLLFKKDAVHGDNGHRQVLGTEYILLLSMDHIVTDFWSMTVLARELLASYEANKVGKEISLPPLNARYSDYVHWQGEMLAGPQGEKHWEYWRDHLGGELPALNLPSDRPRTSMQTYHGDSQHLIMDGELYKQLKALAQEQSSTLFMTLLAAFQTLLHRYSNQEEFIVGSVTAGRSHSELADLVGYFINPIALRADFSGNPTFNEVLQRVRQTALGVFEHQDYPPALLAKRMGLQRDSSRPPLFETMFILQKAQEAEVQALSPFALGIDGARMEIGSLVLESIALGGEPAQFDLTMMMAETGDGLAAAIQYNTDLFDAATIQRMLEHFHSLLQNIVADPIKPVSTYSLLSDSEREQIVMDWNQTQTDYPREFRIHDLIQEQVKRTPNAVAVQFEEKSLTYKELDKRADQVAKVLTAQGVKAGTLVGLFVNRSIEMLIGLLGVLKAGGAYLPLDPSFPSDRLAFMIEDSGASIILTQTSLLADMPENKAQVLCLDALDQSPSTKRKRKSYSAKPDDLAYIIYTSGSTGKPKGVQIHHQAVVNFLSSMRESLQINADDTLFAVTTLSFDIAVLELLLPLTVGARVVIASAEVSADGALLAQALTDSHATFMQATPASWRSLLEAGWQGKDDLKILCGGEALTNDLAEGLLKRGSQLWNLYGPTETTIWSTIYQVTSNQGVSNTVPIGRPIANTQIYILDSNLQPVPVGVIGDLYIGGDGVSHGYLNRPELTTERFISNPFDSSSVIYKTGDIARYLPDGNIEFFGRSDQQVKVRGFRIETGEVEVALAGHPAIRQAVVVAWKERSSDASLVAYVVPASGDAEREADASQLREFLRTKLPEYMVPSIFVNLESLPLTPNGKVDRKALPQPSQARPDLRALYIAPRTPLELELAQICAQVLGLEDQNGHSVVGVHDNFFDLGGHSLLGTRLVFLLREKYELEAAQLPLRALFEQPTVANLARVIDVALKGEGEVVYASRGNFIQSGQLSLEELNAEAQLDPNITAGDLVYEHVDEPKHILLTGATGFVGAFLLHDLLKQTSAEIHCLLRADDFEKGVLRLKRNLNSYLLWDDSFVGRIKPVLGDLGEPQLGLTDEVFEQLAHEIDVIYHNGAMVNFVYPYHAHKASNVLGTQEILRLASHIKLKPVHFVSTLSILYSSGVNDGRIFQENVDLDDIGAPFGGYAQSKWVAEKLVEQAGERGIPYAIYRPGLVSGHSVSGAWNTDNLISSMTRACILLGSVPNLDVMVNIVPVDFVSAAIIHLSKDPGNLSKVYHLDNHEPLHFSKLADWMADQGFSARKVSFDEWRTELFKHVNHMSSGGWEPYLPLLEEVEEKQVFMPEFDLTNTLTGLNGTGIVCHPVNSQLFSTYMKYFTPQDFLEKPETNAK